MRYLFLLVAMLVIAAPCLANDGAITEERVIDLPQDSGKWYVTVYGEPGHESLSVITGWFRDHEGLAKLKRDTHFNTYTSNQAIFKSRYAKGTPTLPAIRVQDAGGATVFLAAGNEIPMTPEALHNAIAIAVNEASAPLLPWRRGIERELKDLHNRPVDPEPAPDPRLDAPPSDGDGPPEMEAAPTGLPTGMVVLLSVLSSLAGGGTGLVVQYRKSYQEK